MALGGGADRAAFAMHDDEDPEELSGVTRAVGGATRAANGSEFRAVLLGEECRERFARWRAWLVARHGLGAEETRRLARRHDEAVADIVIFEA